VRCAAQRNSLCDRGVCLRRIIRVDVRRQTRERAIRHISFRAVRGADFHVPLLTARNFDCLAASELSGDIKTVERIVDPDAILSRIALHGGAVAGKGRGSGGSGNCAREEEEDSQSVSHIVSRTIASGVCGTSRSVVANGACPEPKVRFPSLSFKAFSLPNVPIWNNCTGGQKTGRRKYRVRRTKVHGTDSGVIFRLDSALEPVSKPQGHTSAHSIQLGAFISHYGASRGD
jgi:hypothetical protein